MNFQIYLLLKDISHTTKTVRDSTNFGPYLPQWRSLSVTTERYRLKGTRKRNKESKSQTNKPTRSIKLCDNHEIKKKDTVQKQNEKTFLIHIIFYFFAVFFCVNVFRFVLFCNCFYLVRFFICCFLFASIKYINFLFCMFCFKPFLACFL